MKAINHVPLPVRSTLYPSFVCFAGVDGPVYEHNGAWYVFGSGRNATNAVQASWKSTDQGLTWTATWHTAFVWGAWLNNGAFRPAHHTARVGDIVYIVRRTTTSGQELRVLAFDLTTETMTSLSIETLTLVSASDRRYNTANDLVEWLVPLSTGNIALIGTVVDGGTTRRRVGAWVFNTSTDAWTGPEYLTATYTVDSQTGNLSETPGHVVEYDGKYLIRCYVAGSESGAPRRLVTVTKDLATVTVLHETFADTNRYPQYNSTFFLAQWQTRDVLIMPMHAPSHNFWIGDILDDALSSNKGKWQNDTPSMAAEWVQGDDTVHYPTGFYHPEDDAIFIMIMDDKTRVDTQPLTRALARTFPDGSSVDYVKEWGFTSAHWERDRGPFQRLSTPGGGITYVCDVRLYGDSGSPTIYTVPYFVPNVDIDVAAPGQLAIATPTPWVENSTPVLEAAPIADIDTGGWTEAPLYPKVNEDPPPDDATYIRTEDPYGVCTLQLAAIDEPAEGSTRVTVRTRAYNLEGVDTPMLKVELLQGATVIAERTWFDLSDTYEDRVMLLGENERAAITDWADLRVRLTGDVT